MFRNVTDRLLIALLVIGLFSTLPLPNTVLAQGNLRDIPDVDPNVERQSFAMSEGLLANLFAGDPEIAKPIQINFDGRGRLWVAGSSIYPHIKPGQEANDRILILEDSDHDGVVDKKTVFADGLLIPTGVLPDEKGGCYVANSTELLYLADHDGDGIADSRSVILSGFGTEDTHHLLHTLRWAPDGSLFMNQSIYIHSHIETPYGVKHLNGGGLWRFRPDTLELEVYCKGFVNPWGTGFDQWGQTFVTDGAYGEGINYVFPDSVFATSPGAKRIMSGLNPGSPKHCGLEIISGSHFPDEWQGNMITNDFRANRVCRFVVTDTGTAYTSRQATEVIRSNHVAFRPIDAKLGPDGALYIADWYNPIIQHGEVDFRDPRRDHVHGRIWRVTMEGRSLQPVVDLSTATPTQLIEYLKHPQNDVRLWAKRYLRNQNPETTRQAIQNAIARLPNPPTQDDAAAQADQRFRLELLWAGLNLDHLSEDLLAELLDSPVANARAAAIRVAGNFLRHQSSDRLLQICQQGVADPSAHVRLEAVCLLGRLDSARAAQFGLQALNAPLDANLDFALWNTMRQLAPHWLPLAQKGEFDFGGQVRHLSFALNAADSQDIVGPMLQLLQRGSLDNGTIDDLLVQASQVATPRQLTLLTRWVGQQDTTTEKKLQRWAQMANAAPKPPTELPNLLTELNDQALQDSQLAAALLPIAKAWPWKQAFAVASQWAQDASTPLEFRSSALETLGTMGRQSELTSAATELLSKIGRDDEDLAVRAQAISTLAQLNAKMAAKEAATLLTDWPVEEPTQPLTETLLDQNGGQQALADALTTVKLDATTARQLLRDVRASAQPQDSLMNTIRTSGDLANAGWSFDAQQKQEFLAEVQNMGNPVEGEFIYRRNELQCLNCHAIGGVGMEVGPDLISIGASAPVDYLLDSLLIPNDKVKEGYHSKLIQTIDGKILSGIVTKQTDGKWELRLADNRLVQIPEEDIEQMADGKSLMPVGLVDTLTRQELRDLVSFLSKLGKEEPFAIRGQMVVRAWQTLPWNQQAHHRLNRTSFDSITNQEEMGEWKTIQPLVSGAVPLTGLPEYKIHANVPKTTFLRTRFEVGQGGTVQIQVTTQAHVQLWLDQDPLVLNQQSPVTLTSGEHWLYLAIERKSQADSLNVSIQPAADSPATVQLPVKLP